MTGKTEWLGTKFAPSGLGGGIGGGDSVHLPRWQEYEGRKNERKSGYFK